MKTVIIGSGSINDYGCLAPAINNADCIICADGGTKHAFNMNVVPRLIIGDMDSSDDFYISYFKNKGSVLIEYPVDKDKTDMQICLEYALKFSSEITLLGCTGGRIDHTIANISLLKLGLDKNIPISVVDENNEIRMIKDKIVLKGNIGEKVSLLPIGSSVEGITTQGLHYELKDAVMEFGNPYGVSNYFENSEASICIKSGYLLIIKSKD